MTWRCWAIELPTIVPTNLSLGSNIAMGGAVDFNAESAEDAEFAASTYSAFSASLRFNLFCRRQSAVDAPGLHFRWTLR